MQTQTVPGQLSVKSAPRRLQRLLTPLSATSEGELTLRLPNGEQLSFGQNNGQPAAAVEIHRWRALRRLMTGGTVGWSEAFISGDWDSPDVGQVVQWALNNEARLSELLSANWASRLLQRLNHFLNTNNRRGSRRNIAFHYDLGNNFYRRWLDPSMTYSAGLYRSGDESLEQAQFDKYQNIIDQLAIGDGANVLEIGCGWGGFAEQLCQQKAVSLEGITLSREQLEYARQRLQHAGLGARTRFSLTDYRDTQGQYDHIVSIERLEAVGQRYWPSYFKTLSDRLKPGGSAAIQVITIDEKRFADYSENPDFIQRCIFPGGMLPSIERVLQHSHEANLTCESSVAFGLDYARTLAEWNQRFHMAWDDIAPLGFDDKFKRLWRYYLEYCEGGFRAGSINVYQIFLRKPL